MRMTTPLRKPIVSIINATFHRENTPVFRDLSLTIEPHQKWSILSKSSSARTSLLQILRGQYVCTPPRARTYPALADYSAKAIQYVGFDAERGKTTMRGGYLSARYESLREETDFSLLDFLTNNTDLNPDTTLQRRPDATLLTQVMSDLKLDALADMPVTHLSNGQTRRAKIAKALLSKPQLLLLDGPFMGLDPPTLKHLSQLLGDLQSPRIVLSLKPDEHIPSWITHMAFVTQQHQIAKAGPRNQVIQYIHDRWEELKTIDKLTQSRPLNEEAIEYAEVSRHLWAHTPSSTAFEDRREEMAYQRLRSSYKPSKNRVGREVISRDGFHTDTPTPAPGEALVQMEGVRVQYGDKIVLGDWKQPDQPADALWWDIRRGQRWGVFGPNGSGKTTLISLITSDHPQTYSLPIKLFGRSRLPQAGQPGISIFDLQKRIGHSSPEVHVFFPKHLSLRRTIESAWADTPLTKPKLSFEIDEKVNAALMWFRAELVPSLGPPKWMRAEMDRAIPGFDNGFFDESRELSDPERAAFHLRQAEQALTQERQEMEGETWPDTIKFGDLGFSAQRVALFIRAVIRNPDLVVLDEAFSGMDDFARDKCQLFLSRGEDAIFHLKRFGTPINDPKITPSDLSRLGMAQIPGLQDHQALLIISHKKEEVPGCVRDWICLPESGTGCPPRFGKLDMPLELGLAQWSDIWDDAAVERPGAMRKRRLEIRNSIESREDWPIETPEQRRTRLERHRALIANLKEDGVIPPTDFGPGVRRSVRDPEVIKKRRRDLAKLHIQIENAEETDLRRAKLRARWRARLDAMTPEERTEFIRTRNAKYLEDRPDRVARHRELARLARTRWLASRTDEERLELNRVAREKRREKAATMSTEEKAEAKRLRKEKHQEKMKDPEYAAKWRASHAVSVKRHRDKKKLQQKEVGEVDP